MKNLCEVYADHRQVICVDHYGRVEIGYATTAIRQLIQESKSNSLVLADVNL